MKKLFLMVCIAGLIVSAVSSQSLVAQEESKVGEKAPNLEELKVGDKAPDFALATFDEGTVTLSERFGDAGHPTILLFSRANW